MAKRKLPLLAEHSVAAVLSARVDVATAFAEGVQANDTVSCHSGCSNCCYHPVHLSAIEGILLYRWLVAHGRWTPSLKAKITNIAERTRDISYEIWLLSMLPCPLLDEATKRCTAYQGRPFACRVTFSTGDPHHCHPHRIMQAMILDTREVTKDFYVRVRREVKKHGITMIIMPLSVALLIGEKIATGEYDLEAADLAILKDYAEVS